MIATTNTDDRLLGIKEIAAVVGESVRTVHRWIDAGKVPQPIGIGHKLKWRSSTIQEWIRLGCPDANKPR